MFHQVSCEDGVNSNAYANGAVLALVITNDGIHNARIRRDKGVERLRTAYGLYEHLSNKKQCCKDDQQSQGEMLKFDPQLPLNPLSDRHQIWHA